MQPSRVMLTGALCAVGLMIGPAAVHAAPPATTHVRYTSLAQAAAEDFIERGVARSAVGDNQGAIGEFDQALRIEPNNADAYLGRGAARAALGDNPGALADFDQAIRLNPNEGEAYLARGAVRGPLGDNRGAAGGLS